MTLPAPNVRLVQVGDHPAEPSPFARRRAAELYAVKKASPSADEILALRDRLFDASLHLKAAINNEHFAGIRSAYIDLAEIHFQLGEMTSNLARVIEAAQKEFRA